MSGQLLEIWEASSSSPFYPSIAKSSQLVVGFVLLVIAILLTTVFALDRSLGKAVTLGLPASVLFGFSAVYLICGAGVYV